MFRIKNFLNNHYKNQNESVFIQLKLLIITKIILCI